MECVRKWGDIRAFNVERERRRKHARGELREVLQQRAAELFAPAEPTKVLAFPARRRAPMSPSREATELLRRYLEMDEDDRARIFGEMERLASK